MTYKLATTSLGQTVVIRDNGDSTTTSFLQDPANTDYQQYLAWLAQGNTPTQAE